MSLVLPSVQCPFIAWLSKAALGTKNITQIDLSVKALFPVWAQ